VVQELGTPRVAAVVDLGCGTGAAGCGWALAQISAGHPAPRIRGIDRHPWAVEEARRTYTDLELPGIATRGQIVHARFPEAPAAIVAAYTINELDDAPRAAMLDRLLHAATRGAHVLIVEPNAPVDAPTRGASWRSCLTWYGGWTAPPDWIIGN
jgi:trans-aconitate methyltransferase